MSNIINNLHVVKVFREERFSKYSVLVDDICQVIFGVQVFERGSRAVFHESWTRDPRGPRGPSLKAAGGAPWLHLDLSDFRRFRIHK